MKLRTLILFALAAVVLAACGSEGDGSTTTEADTTTTADAGQEEPATTTTEAEITTTAAADTTTSAAEMADGVHVAETDLGEILVDPDGFTLYIFTPDVDGESTCYEGCADTWPPVPADTPISSDLDDSMFGSAPRTDGGDQLTVNGMPLYRFAPDGAPGDTNGQGVNDVWFVVDAQGGMIEAAAGATQENTSGPADDGYDY